MTRTKLTETTWDPENKLIVTNISGDIETQDVAVWEQDLQTHLDLIPENSAFKILVNMYGFKAVDIESHKKFRTIVPLTLAQYGWKVGYLGLFEDEAKTMTFESNRGIRCVAAAHVHQDETKMQMYETRFSRDNEHFFIDPVQATSWIKSLAI